MNPKSSDHGGEGKPASPDDLPQNDATDDTGSAAESAAFSPETVSVEPSAEVVEPSTDAELAAVIDAWPTLPAALRAGIVAMVRASAAGDGAEAGK